MLEANVDDLDPRLWPGVLSALLAAGASDAWLTPILMKKGRPAHTLSVLTAADRARGRARAWSSARARRSVSASTAVGKHALDREMRTVDVRGQAVRVKVARLAGEVVNAAPEYDDVVAAAAALGAPVKSVLAEAVAAAHTGHAGPPPGSVTMDLAVVATTFALIFPVELPDKTFVASLVLATRYRPLLVWIGVSLAFLVQTVVAVTAGGLLSLLPKPVVVGASAVLFLVGAVVLWRGAKNADAEEAAAEEEFAGKAAGEAHGVEVVATVVRCALPRRVGRPVAAADRWAGGPLPRPAQRVRRLMGCSGRWSPDWPRSSGGPCCATCGSRTIRRVGAARVPAARRPRDVRAGQSLL